MDRENDNSSDGTGSSGVPPTGPSLSSARREPGASVGQSVIEDTPGVQAQSAIADPLELSEGPRNAGPRLPLPLVPSEYVATVQPIVRPSIAATLPPSLRHGLERSDFSQRIEPVFSRPIDNARLTLAPETHVLRTRDAEEDVARLDRAVAPPPSPSVQTVDDAFVRTPVAALAVDVPRRNTTVEDAPAASLSPPETAKSVSDYVRLALKYAVFGVAAWLALIVFLIAAYRFIDPPMSSLMLQQRLLGQDVQQTWVPMEDISPQIVRAVLLSEDGRFCDHTGVDFDAMQDAIERAGDGAPRGASTISMQVTKNLFLWPSKSYVRKAIEIPLTWAMELVWPKRRIMEIYLNIAEWGPGIFGVEAASQFHFQKAAKRLNEREAAQLAVALPNPYMRDAGDPGPKTRRLASDIQARMRNASISQTSCVLGPAAGR